MSGPSNARSPPGSSPAQDQSPRPKRARKPRADESVDWARDRLDDLPEVELEEEELTLFNVSKNRESEQMQKETEEYLKYPLNVDDCLKRLLAHKGGALTSVFQSNFDMGAFTLQWQNKLLTSDKITLDRTSRFYSRL